MQMQFDLDYLGHSATLSFPSDDMHMQNIDVLPSEIQQSTAVLSATRISQVFCFCSYAAPFSNEKTKPNICVLHLYQVGLTIQISFLKFFFFRNI